MSLAPDQHMIEHFG